MQLHFEPVTAANRNAVEKLHVAAGQETFVETCAECLAEADTRKCWRPVGIYHGPLLIGFAMYGFFWEYLPWGRVWLDRLLIDAAFQHKGYGRAAMQGLLDRLREEYGRRKIYLSVYDNNPSAIRLYEEFGFHFNGEKDIHGEKVMVRERCANPLEA